MLGWIVRVHLPLAHLGRLDLPKARLRYRNGWVRTWQDKKAERLTCILEDREGTAIPMATQHEARAESLLMGQVVAHRLQQHTKYELCDEVGNPAQVRVAVG